MTPRNSHRGRKVKALRLAAALLASLSPTAVVRAQIVPDGRTATSTSTAVSGQITVGIAPANPSGISHNSYNTFSVAPPGANLNNRGVDATTIVNEVTSTQRSLINGPVEVLGSRAHVVLANPNGITVDGGSFLNTGGVVMSAGSVRYDTAGLGGFVNTVVTTGSSDITVTGAGLSGSMTTLQLVASRLSIDAPIVNSNLSPNADISLVAGHSEVTLNSSVSPLTTLTPLTTRRDLDASSSDILVDVTPRGSLSASRVSIAVNSRGAGVSFAGSGQATIGDFLITAKGKVTTRGANLQAEKTLQIVAPAIDVLSTPSGQSTLASISGTVTLLATSGDINLMGAITGYQRSSDPQSMGGVTLQANGDINLLSANATQLAIAFASNDDLYVQAGGNLTNQSGRLLTNANLVVRANGSLTNETPTTTAVPSFDSTIFRKHEGGLFGWLFGVHRRTVITRMDAGAASLPGKPAYLAGQTVDIQAGAVQNSGEIDALSGGLSIATGTFLNQGLQTGTATFVKTCGITCWSRGTGSQVIGGIVNAAGSAEIDASQSVSNSGGQITAYGNLLISSPSVAGQAIFQPSFKERPAGLSNFFAGGTAIPALAPYGGDFLAPNGTLTIQSTEPVTLVGGTALGAVATNVPASIDQVQAAKSYLPLGVRHIGILRSLVP